jgi:hypothetical protein
MEVGNPVGDPGSEPGAPAEREDLIVEGPRIFGGDEDERLRLKIRNVDDRPAGERVMARQRDDDRVSPDGFIDRPDVEWDDHARQGL